MRKFKTETEAYDSCLTNGYINEIKQSNVDRIGSLIVNAETLINSAQIIIKAINKQAKEWMSVYISYYGALRIYTEALLVFDKVSISNHQCLFVYLCVKHPDMVLDWNFFEKVRTKRNGANYYGEKIMYDDWKAIEVQIKIYISTLKKEVEKKLSEA